MEPVNPGTDTQVRSRCLVSVFLPDLDEDPEALWPLIQDIPQIWFPGKTSKPKAGLEDIETIERRNAEATARLTWERERLAPFNLMHRCWLLECRKADSLSRIELVFDSSYLRTRVPESPAKVRLVLEGGRASLRKPSGIEPINGAVEKFMVMGAALEGETAILKPHRKERGQVVVDFVGCEMFDEVGSSLPQSRLLEYVQRFWST